MIDVLMAAAIAMAHPQAPADTTVVTVAEDDPAFDCRHDGEPALRHWRRPARRIARGTW